MNKLLILISFLYIFSIKLSAYEYLIYRTTENLNQPNNTRFVFYTGENGRLYQKQIRQNGEIYNSNTDLTFYNSLGYIKRVASNNEFGYISKEVFINYYTNNELFLNDLYLQQTQPFLNFLYNDNIFSASNHVIYENYELLYNSEGLAVESIVNGVWAGLYDGPDQSGYMYDEKGDLKYINGVPPSFFERSFNKLIRRFGINLQSVFIRQIFIPLLIFIFACVVLRSVIRIAFQAFLIRFYDKKIGQLEKRREKIENA